MTSAYTQSEYCFFDPEESKIIDYLREDNLTTLIERQTLEQVRESYPEAIKLKIEKAWTLYEEAAITKPEEITEEEFDWLLNVLPPKNWWHGNNCESFIMIEHDRGSVTRICVRDGQKYYKFSERNSLTPYQILDKIRNC
ncbi:MAG: hypothetical protein QNJ34_28615 [Xenococcaceae cyanobacterium MO_188.B29]|nr:hypothetical protein [Xenococcaceae cyanobacterium MO_188.B29]